MAEHIGYLCNGNYILCEACHKPRETTQPGTRIFAENIGQYEQRCFSCKRILHAGHPGWPELFEGAEELQRVRPHGRSKKPKYHEECYGHITAACGCWHCAQDATASDTEWTMNAQA